MKLTKKNVKTIILITILILLLSLVFFNIKVFKKILNKKETRNVCNNLEIGDKCQVITETNNITGYCKEIREGIIVCKPEDESNQTILGKYLNKLK